MGIFKSVHDNLFVPALVALAFLRSVGFWKGGIWDKLIRKLSSLNFASLLHIQEQNRVHGAFGVQNIFPGGCLI